MVVTFKMETFSPWFASILNVFSVTVAQMGQHEKLKKASCQCYVGGYGQGLSYHCATDLLCDPGQVT